jgi:rfaE bifunctional protein nucleotidyltransferase chain/domain
MSSIVNKIVTWSQAGEAAARARRQGRVVVFTNGCFDILHIGHTRYLGAARELGDLLIVGVNSDDSVRALGKAPDRPLNGQDLRAEILANLEVVDYVCIFTEPTPAKLIALLKPQVLVKGGDWPPEKIVGADMVRAAGGRVVSIPLTPGHSTTGLLARIRRTPA